MVHAAGTDPAGRELFPPDCAGGIRFATRWTYDGNPYLMTLVAVPAPAEPETV
jgi:hypothetical protein